MADIEMASQLSDKDLRLKLTQYGIQSPVTATTRQVLIKKLNQAIANERKGVTTRRKSGKHGDLKSVSSDEEDFGNLGRVSARSRTIDNYTNANHSNKQIGTRRRSGQLTVSKGNSISNCENVTKTENRFNGPTIKHGSNFHNGDDEEDSSDDDHDFDGSFGNFNDKNKSKSFNGKQTLKLNQDLLFDNSDATCSDSDVADYSKQTLCSHRSMRSNLSWSKLSRPSTGSRIGFQSVNHNGEDFSSPSFLSHNKDENAYMKNVTCRTNRILTKFDEPGHKLQQKDGTSCRQLVPLFLVVTFGIFFVVLGGLYLNQRVSFVSFVVSLPSFLANSFLGFWKIIWSTPSSSVLLNGKSHVLKRNLTDSFNSIITICGTNETVSDDCLTSDELKYVNPLIGKFESDVLPSIFQREYDHQCRVSQFPHVTMKELFDLYEKILPHLPRNDIEIGLKVLPKLFSQNPHLGIKVFHDEENSPVGLLLISAPVSWLCRVKAVAWAVFLILCCTLTVSFLLWLYHYRMRKLNEKKQQIFELVEKIMEILSNVSSSNNKDYIAVDNVRDLLIKPNERKSKSLLWQEAVVFIDTHESRVYRGLRRIAGDDVDVWRWVSTVPLEKAGHTSDVHADVHVADKTWQGQAFENSVSPNRPTMAYSSCLKIRNMFDCEVECGDTWSVNIKDAILEKCEGIPIIHLIVDESSREGCVYMKCSSVRDAGKAYRVLHGWWYDGNLVTVKFLREERYNQRFPKSCANNLIPLRPSNEDKLSLRPHVSNQKK